ncbi:MAG: hypothetical protein M3Q71_18430 [Chloroflexota bacterium]|nr:hypothetical protein [Chloroflexota bacterium]MDP9472612.1 hypothetical protein [Chloroflexota bacterium]
MSTPHGPDEYLSVEMAGQVSGIPPRTLRRWVRAGRLPATEGPRGKLVRLGDALALAELTGRHSATDRPSDGQPANRAMYAGHMTGQASDHGDEGDQESATSGHVSAISPAARSQLEAIRDEWLAPLVERIQNQAERIGRLEAERNHLQAEVERLRAAQDAPSVAPAVHHATEPTNAAPDTSPSWWVSWWRRFIGGDG